MTRYLVMMVFSFAIVSVVKGQSSHHAMVAKSDTQIYTIVDKEPEFSGGLDKFNRFMAENVHLYAKDFRKDNFQASFIFQLIIEKDGRISNVQELKRIPNSPAGKRIIRMLKKSPRWQPGFQNGHPVRVKYLLPLKF